MSTDPAASSPAGLDAVDALARAKYASLTTFRKSGAGVATPVWIARDGGELVVITVDATGKTKRLARDARVTLQACDFRGNLDAAAPVFSGSARVVRGDDEVWAVRRAIGRKYLSARLGNVLARFGLLGSKPRAGIRITLH